MNNAIQKVIVGAALALLCAAPAAASSVEFAVVDARQDLDTVAPDNHSHRSPLW